jgi:hypothetical protein
MLSDRGLVTRIPVLRAVVLFLSSSVADCAARVSSAAKYSKPERQPCSEGAPRESGRGEERERERTKSSVAHKCLDDEEGSEKATIRGEPGTCH